MAEIHQLEWTRQSAISHIHENWPAVDGRKFAVVTYIKPLQVAFKEHGFDVVLSGTNQYMKWLKADPTRKPMSPPRFFSEGHFLSEYETESLISEFERSIAALRIR